MEKVKRIVEDLTTVTLKGPKIDLDQLRNHGLKDITLRDYQLDGVNWLVGCYHGHHGAILADEMGLGKTCQTIAFLCYLRGSKESGGPHLILCPLSVLNNWKDELSRFAPDLKVVSYVGDKDTREELRDDLRKDMKNVNVLLTTYEVCLKDETFLHKYGWHTLVVDEAHRLKNRESLLHQILKEFDITHHLLLTGTPVQNNMKELYALLSFVAPKIFRGKYQDDFLEMFGDVSADTQDAAELHKILVPFVLRRIKSDVIKDLPKKSEVVLYHGMSALQKKYYKAILTKDIDAFDTNNTSAPTKTRLMNILMQLRKCVNHPYIFDGVEPEPFEIGDHLIEASGKLVIIDQLLTHLKRCGHKVLLFSQMTRMLDILQDYLGYRGYNYERLDGSVRGEERYLAVSNFNTEDDTFIFLLSTRAGGQGLNLVSADTVIFVDSDYNPQNDLQAAARAHRIGQKRPVKIIRLVGRSTVEEVILQRAEAKLKLTNTVIEGGQFSQGLANNQQLFTDDKIQMQDILKFGVDKLFETEDSTVEDVDFDTILGQSKKGEWQDDDANKESQATLAESTMDVDEDEETEKHMYMFEGKDYSKEPSAEDEKFFENLIKAEKAILSQAAEGGFSLRKNRTATVSFMLPEVVRKPKKKKVPTATLR